jgi:hypothetical protein
MKKTFIALFLLAALLPADSKPIKFTLGNWLWKPASNQALLTTSSPTFAGLTLSGGTASTLAYLNGSKAFTSLANSAGYLLNDGSGGLSYAAALKPDGTVPLTADWNVGAFNLTASRFISGVGAADTPAFGEAGNSGLSFSAAGGSILFNIAGATKATLSGSSFTIPSAIYLLSTSTAIRRIANNQIQFGNNATTAPANQILQAAGSTDTDGIGANFNINGGQSVGAGDGGSVKFSTTPAGASGAVLNSWVERMSIDSTGTVTVGSSGGAGTFKVSGANAQTTNIQQSTVVVTTTAAATATATNLIPAGSMVVGVTCRNTTAVTGDAGFTGYSIGDGSDVDRWGANVNPAINETTDLTDCTITSPAIYAAATSVVLTQIGGSRFDADKTIRVTVHYLSLTAPTT